MTTTVEFFGIPRLRAGVASTTAEGNCLGDVLAELSCRFPLLAETCIDGRTLRSGYTINLNGQRFVSDPELPLSEGDAVMLLSIDAGG